MDEQELKPPPRPVWVTWLAVVAILLVMGIAVLVLLPGQHGPGRHG